MGRQLPGLENPPRGENITERLTVEAEKFLEQNASRPFFLYLPHYTVHTPLQAGAELVSKYQAAGASGLQRNPTFAAMVEGMDAAVGRVLKKLDELKLRDKTLVIFTSDNGGLATSGNPTKIPATNNAPLREGQGLLVRGGRARGPARALAGRDRPRHNIRRAHQHDRFASDHCRGLPDEVYRPARRSQHLASARRPKRSAARSPVLALSALQSAGRASRRIDSPGRFQAHRILRLAAARAVQPGRRSQREYQPDRARPQRAAQLADRLHAWLKETGADMPTPNLDFVPNPQAADGIITLPAETADIHGTMLRYEPLPHKNTLGFWVRPQDWASWNFRLQQPGAFTVEILQGCGAGNGGSEVEFSIGDQKLSTQVEDTGGFQNFKTRSIGTLKLDKPGDYTLSVKPRNKKHVAVMDLREVRLVPAK